MNNTRYAIKDNGVVELNFIAATYTGQIEAQTPAAADVERFENGMIVYVDRKDVVIDFAKAGSAYLHFSPETFYMIGSSSKSSFVYIPSDRVMPRVYKLAEGDMFHTNVLKLGTFLNEAALETALEDGATVYGYVDGTDGVIYASDVEDTDEDVEFIIRKSTMQTDAPGFNFWVNRV